MLTVLVVVACARSQPEHTGLLPVDVVQITPDPSAPIDFVDGQTFLVVLDSPPDVDPRGSWLVDDAYATGTVGYPPPYYTYTLSTSVAPQFSVEFEYEGGSFTWTAAEP